MASKLKNLQSRSWLQLALASLCLCRSLHSAAGPTFAASKTIKEVKRFSQPSTFFQQGSVSALNLLLQLPKNHEKRFKPCWRDEWMTFSQFSRLWFKETRFYDFLIFFSTVMRLEASLSRRIAANTKFCQMCMLPNILQNDTFNWFSISVAGRIYFIINVNVEF